MIMKSIQLKILLSFLLLASHKANSMAWEELSLVTGANRDEVMAENKRRTDELNEKIAAQNAQQITATEPQAATNSNIQDDSATPPAPADTPSAAASSTTVANPETYDLKGWGWESTAPADKAPYNDNADDTQLSINNSKDAFAPADDVATDDNNNAEGPLPSRPAPTDDDDISDIVSIHSDDDDSESEPAIATTSSAAPNIAPASTLPAEYAFVTNGDSSQHAEEELLAYAQNVFNGVRDCIAALNDPCLNNNELKQDALDAQSLVNWATALHKQSKDNRSFILVPKSTLDACLARLKELSEKFCKNQSTLKVETNYTNPNGMGDIDTFDIPLNLMPEQTTQAATTSASTHPLTDDNNNDDWTTDEEEAGQSFDSQSAPHAEAPQEYSLIDEDALLSYAQVIRDDIETKIKEMTEDEKLLWQETISCDFNDAIEILIWATALKNSTITAIPTGTIDKIIKRLHQLALVYSKKDHTIQYQQVSTDIGYPEMFERPINIYSPEDDVSSGASTSSSNDDDDASSSGDDTENKTGSESQGDKKPKADSKIQSDGSTSDDDDDTSSFSLEDDSEPQKYPNDKKTSLATTSSFTGNMLKLVKNKFVLAGGAVAAAICYWQYYYTQDTNRADQPA